MKGFSLLVLLAIICTSNIQASKSISGYWKNQLNSCMYLNANNYTLTGWYRSAVGQACGHYNLLGNYNNDQGLSTISWSVAWSNTQCGDSHSATGWSGQLATDGAIYTTWTLTSLVDDIKSLWSATRIGQDIFQHVSSC